MLMKLNTKSENYININNISIVKEGTDFYGNKDYLVYFVGGGNANWTKISCEDFSRLRELMNGCENTGEQVMEDNVEKYMRRIEVVKSMNPNVKPNFLITVANCFDKVCSKINDSELKKLILDMLTMLFGRCNTVDELSSIINSIDKYVGE